MEKKQIKKLCFVVSTEMSATSFLLPHIKNLSGEYSISIILNTKNTSLFQEIHPKVSVFSVPIDREISLISDVINVIRLFSIFRKGKYDVVQSITPKAGLLSMLASLLARVPLRIHWFTGQVWVTKKGMFKTLLKQMDRLIYLFATDVLVDSASQRKFLVECGVIKLENATVLGMGSVCGVDTRIFRPDKVSAIRIRKTLGINPESFVILYLGRINSDKGVINLGRVFSKLAKRYNNLELLIVGPDEGSLDEVLSICKDVSFRVKVVGFTKTPEKFINASDLLCLPSFREGFGSVVIEAGACKVPSVVSRIYGLIDALEDGVTGLMHDPQSLNEMEGRIEEFVSNERLRQRMGNMAMDRVLLYFDQRILLKELREFYQRLLSRSI